MKAVRLKTEYLYNPLGIDITCPRLFWNCEGGSRQTAYHIIARDDAGDILWESGKLPGSRMAGIPYGGQPLGSRAHVTWQVRLWDENDVPGAWSETASFELGLLTPVDWQARWITGDYKPAKRRRFPVDAFRRGFTLARPVAKARLYITACGVYEARVNGQRAGDFILAPGFTDYRKRLQYQTIDVTALLREGDNELTAQLADGWYRGSLGAMGVTSFYGIQTRLLFQLEVTHVDGTRVSFVSDESTDWSNDGPLRFADLKDGEVCDLRKSPSYCGKARLTGFPLLPCASNNVPVTEHERFTPGLLTTPSNKTLLDFGQTISGYLEFIVNARAGQHIHLRMAEKLTDGELDMGSIQVHAGKPNATPRQEISLTCATGENHYKTSFAVFGFRFAEVTADFPIDPAHFTAIAVYSDMEEVGEFHCSNPLINKLVENTRWSMKGNFLDVPTDCPTRERAGWTGDAQIFCKTGTYLMDTAAFFRKWLRDLRDRQTARGKVHCIVPSVGNELYMSRMDGCCGWADAAVLVPSRLFELYSDRQLLEECYASMKAHVRFQISRCNRTGFCGKPVFGPDRKYISNAGQAFGEWLEPRDMYQQSILKDLVAPHPEEATAYLSWVCAHMVKIAQVLGHREDIPLYEEYRAGCKAAYNHRFAKDGDIASGRQSKLVRPLALDLLEGETKQRVFARLLATIEQRHYHIGTGFLSTPLILPLLTSMGCSDIAYSMLESEEAPGWLHEVKAGATTIWEDWEGHASHNHYAYGSVCEWLFETVCGVRVAGENHFDLAPLPGGTLTHAHFAYTSIYGRVACAWEKGEGTIRYTITVPAGTSATVRLSGTAEVLTLAAGEHILET